MISAAPTSTRPSGPSARDAETVDDTVDAPPPKPLPEDWSEVDGLRWVYAAATHQGLVREKNDDAYHAGGALFLVADGMGGHADGDIAAQLAVEIVRDAFPFFPGTALGARADLVSAVGRANAAIYTGQADKPLPQRMGTTLTAAMIVDRRLALAHVGDSRLYRLRGRELWQVTTDHVHLGHFLERAVGTHPEVEVDAFVLDLEPGDVLFLCTDGISKAVHDKALAAFLLSCPSPGRAATEILQAYLAMGADDNGTCIVVRIEGGVP